MARRETRCTLTIAPSQTTKRAARAAEGPAAFRRLAGAPQRALTHVCKHGGGPDDEGLNSPPATEDGFRRDRHPAGAISVGRKTQGRGRRAQRASWSGPDPDLPASRKPQAASRKHRVATAQARSASAIDNAAVTDPQTIAVIDFETTGMSPAQGARATEVAAVLVRDGRIVGRFASLMRSGAWVPPFIQQLTGISNRMLASAPPSAEVMQQVSDFTAGCGVVAHNAAFDRGFWQHERAMAGCGSAGDAGHGDPGDRADGPRNPPPLDDSFACTLLLSRRLFPEVPNHRLGTLAQWHGIVPTGRAHRALADAEVTAELWLRIVGQVQRRYAATVPFGLLRALQRTPRAGLERCVQRYFAGLPADTSAAAPRAAQPA